MKKKSLQELTISSAFMFGAVMIDPELCKEFLERVLEISIARVEVSKEKSIVYNPEYKGVRLDIYAEDENNTRYNVEMQALSVEAITRRARYYHAQVDMETLLSGLYYDELPDTYVIFVCDFDPFGLGLYRYTQKSICAERQEFSIEDGARTIFLSTQGKNELEVPKELVNFLKYVTAPLEQSEQNFHDDYIERLQKAVREVKQSREMGARYMSFEEHMRDQWKAGRAVGREEGREEGRAELIINALKKELTPEEISNLLGVPIEEVLQVKEELQKNIS